MQLIWLKLVIQMFSGYNINFTLLNRSSAKPLFGQDYFDKFNPQTFLQMSYSANSLCAFRLFGLKQLHEFYQSYAPGGAKLKILDIGSGPTIAYAINAAPYAAEIVLSEYTEANRAALLQWLTKDPKAFDWTPVFKHVVVDLEGKSEEEVPIRAELVRKVVKAVVPCDINRDPPIPPQYVDQYDIVTDFMCLESACATRKDYVTALITLYHLLKSGGRIILYTAEYKQVPTPATYPVGPHKFFDLGLSRDLILKSLEEAGFCVVKTVALMREDLGLPEDYVPDIVAVSFITASKMN